ncbi:lipopolysaccharide biosynthesis protein [Oleiphilus messinensis]|nr:lipopolysaccharide biosynthesis protein [Oleiphilus messinensis]
MKLTENQSVLKQTAYYAAGLLVMKGSAFLILPITTGYLGTESFGSLDILLTWLSVGGILLGLGLTEAMYRFVGSSKTVERKAAVAGVAYRVQIMACILGFLLCFALKDYAPEWLPGNITDTQWLLASAVLVVTAATALPLAWLRLQEQASLFFWLTSGKAAFQAATTFVLLELGAGIDGVLLSGLFSSMFLVIALNRFVLPKIIVKPVLSTTQTAQGFWLQSALELLKYSTPIIASGLLVFLTFGAEKWILAALTDTQSLALYAVAIQFAALVPLALEPFAMWWFPKRFELLQQANGRICNGNLASLGCCFSFLSALIFGWITPHVVQLWLPAEFHPAANLLPMLCFAMALKQCSHLLNTGCYTNTSPTIVFKLNAVTSILALGTFSIAIYLFSLPGLVYGFVAVYLGRTILFVRASQKRLHLPYRYGTIFGSALLCALGLGFASRLDFSAALFSVGLTAGLTLALIYKAGLLSVGPSPRMAVNPI